MRNFKSLLVKGAVFQTLTLVIWACVIYYNQVNLAAIKERGDYEIIKIQAKGPLKANDSKLIDFIRHEYLIPPSTKNYNLSKNVLYKSGSKHLTWNFIDKHLKYLFRNEPPGFFIEAGALDGEYLSNTLWLEKKKNWTGLLIEPDPTNFAVLMKKNRKAWKANVGLSSVPYPERSVFTIIDAYEKKYVQDDFFGIWGYKGHSFNSHNGYSIEDYSYFPQSFSSVQCFPLESLLLALNVTVVDFLSLDIQGREWDVLKLFPFDRIKVRAMVVEYYVDNIPKKFSQTFVDYFQEKGFFLLDSSYEPDYFFVNIEERKMLRT